MRSDIALPYHPSYRPDIDGLRAVAILSVLGFHAFPSWLPGGFIGVDIFFVISGFLISGILLANLREGRFSIADFYARRVRRIFPALITVLLTVAAFGFVVLWPGEYGYLGKHIAAGAGFILNFLLGQETGYFDGHSDTKPLLHLWSLGVEEQFYIFWPLMLGAAWKWKHRAGLMIAVVIVVSFATNIWLAHTDAIADFYSPFSRFWELLAGGALAWSAQNGILRLPSRLLANSLSIAGMALIIVADFALNKDMQFPGVLALLPICGAVLIVAAGETSCLNRKLLANRPMIGVGLISYPLYLWHWPLLSFAQILSGEIPERNVRIAMIVLAFVLAFLTYKYIERPVRKRPLGRKTIGPLLAGMCAIGVAGVVLVGSNGLPQRFADGSTVAQELNGERLIEAWEKSVRMNSCHLQDRNADMQPAECIESTRPLVLLWGDSHAASLYPGLKRLQAEHGFGIAQLTQAGCPPLFDIRELPFRKNCNSINRRILAQAVELKASVIILSAAWRHPDYPMENAEIVERLKDAVIQIKQVVPLAKIIVVGPEPRWTSPLPALYRRRLTFDHDLLPAHMDAHLDAAVYDLDGILSAQMVAHDVDYLSPQKQLCNASGCLTRLGEGLDSLTFVDEEHVTANTSEFLVHQFARPILDGLDVAARN
jgi:peptidoglycan/LPS O-acetylase OafA/YrhL